MTDSLEQFFKTLATKPKRLLSDGRESDGGGRGEQRLGAELPPDPKTEETSRRPARPVLRNLPSSIPGQHSQLSGLRSKVFRVEKCQVQIRKSDLKQMGI
jgi:hypothetical protein